MEFTKEEVARLKEWFGVVQDLSMCGYLEKADYVLAEKIYKKIGARVPNSIKKELTA